MSVMKYVFSFRACLLRMYCINIKYWHFNKSYNWKRLNLAYLTDLIQLWKSLTQSVLHLNRSQANHPMGGVRAKPLSILRHDLANKVTDKSRYLNIWVVVEAYIFSLFSSWATLFCLRKKKNQWGGWNVECCSSIGSIICSNLTDFSLSHVHICTFQERSNGKNVYLLLGLFQRRTFLYLKHLWFLVENNSMSN